MPYSVERMEEHGERKEALERNLCSGRPRRNSRNHARSLKVPSRVRCSEVCDAEEVEGARKRDAGDSVQRRGVPGDLGPVDGEVGRDGALEALLAQNLGGFLLGSSFGCCKAVHTLLEAMAGRGGGGGNARTYRRWMMRPAGWILKLGAAARRRPSWNTRWEAIVFQSAIALVVVDWRG